MVNGKGPSYWIGFISGRIIVYGAGFWLIGKISSIIPIKQPNNPQK
jgi:hypothetical protein